MSSLSTIPKGDSAWLLRKAVQRIMQQVSVLETNIGSSTTGNSANTQIIFNDAGTLRGDPDLIFSTALNRLVVNNIETAGALQVGTDATITGNLTVRTNQLIVNSSGVGVGTTPSAWSGIGPAIQVEQASLLSESSNQLYLTANGYFADGQWKYINNASTDQYYQIAGSHVWRNGTGGSPGTAIGWSTLMTLNSTGLGVGAASPAYKLDIRSGATSIAAQFASTATTAYTPSAYTGDKARLLLTGGNATDATIGLALSAGANNENYFGVVQEAGGSGAFVWQGYNGSAYGERMRLDSAGNFLVGTTTATVNNNGFRVVNDGVTNNARLELGSASTTNSNIGLSMYSTGGTPAYRFYVGWGGTVFATNTTISAISDARFKENVQDIDVGLGAILALKPRKFDWKAGKGKDIKGDRGFIAQEFEQVFPNLIDEWKDEAPEGEAPYKSVRQDLIPVLVKAIQELTARVQTLETR